MPEAGNLMKTTKGYKDSEQVGTQIFHRIIKPHIPTLTSLAVKAARLGVYFTPGVAREWISDRAAEYWTSLYAEDPVYAERMLNEANYFICSTDEELQEKIDAEEASVLEKGEELTLRLPLQLAVLIRDFSKDIRDRTLPKLPPPKVIDATDIR